MARFPRKANGLACASCLPQPPGLGKETNNPARSVNVVFVDGHVETRPIGTMPTNFEDPFGKGITGR
jgi:prepilin-type processing-associated H-X9-DG protein